jgi:predicted component of type VI protein secretion system
VPKDVAFFGRREDNDVVLPFTFVSSRHGRILRRGGALLVEDMGSTNGTNLNGQPLTPMVPHPLKPEDTVEIEKLLIRARFVEEFDEPDVPVTFHEDVPRPSAASLGGTVRISATAASPSALPSAEKTGAPKRSAVASVVSPIVVSTAGGPPADEDSRALSAPALAAPLPLPAPLPESRLEPPTTMWEIQTGAALSAAARADAAEAGAAARLGQASLPDVIATGRMLQRLHADEGDDRYLLWELFFKGLGLVAVLAGLVLMVMVLAA